MLKRCLEWAQSRERLARGRLGTSGFFLVNGLPRGTTTVGAPACATSAAIRCHLWWREAIIGIGPMFARLLMLLPAAACLSVSPAPLRTPLTINRASPPTMNSWMEAQKKRKEAERQQYRILAERAEAQQREKAEAAAAAAEAGKQAEREAQERIANYQDNVDLYRPGGVMRQPSQGITREMLQNSRKTRSAALDAEERVKDALKTVGELPAAEAVEMLDGLIEEAREAGVRDTTPNMKKALALRGSLQTAAKGSTDTAKTDPQKNAFDALFGGGYAPPGGEDDLDWL